MLDDGEGSPRVCLFESRRADEMVTLVKKMGAAAVAAPSMREIAIQNNPIAIRFVHDAVRDRFPFIILLTGVGTEALFEVARSQGLLEDLHAAMRRATIIVRGPKPAAVLHRVGIPFAIRAPEPNTWRELLAAVDQAASENPQQFDLRGQAVAVQEYGLPNDRLYQALTERGAEVSAVPVYRWALPEDTGPLMNAIREIAEGTIDVILFTSANQIVNVLKVAEQLSLSDAFRIACGRKFVASIGPTCSEALRDLELPVHFEASPPKMGPLVRNAIETWRKSR